MKREFTPEHLVAYVEKEVKNGRTKFITTHYRKDDIVKAANTLRLMNYDVTQAVGTMDVYKK